MTVATGLGSEQPDNPVIGELADRVNEHITEVVITIAEPHQNDIDDVVVIVADQG